MATASAWLIAHGAVAPNLGQFVGLSPVVSLVPALVLFAFGLVAAARKFPASRPRPATAAAIGVAVLAVTLAMPVRVSSENRFHREALASDRADAGRSP